jgi:hypothetical protein
LAVASIPEHFGPWKAIADKMLCAIQDKTSRNGQRNRGSLPNCRIVSAGSLDSVPDFPALSEVATFGNHFMKLGHCLMQQLSVAVAEITMTVHIHIK